MPIKHTKIRKSTKKKSPVLRYVLLALGALLIGFVIYLIIMPAKLWGSESRLALAVPTKEGSIKVLVFDPQTHSITTLHIPGNTELEVAHQLGSWKAASIYKLGVNEKLGGRLISETVTKSLRLPTEAWAEESALGFTSGNSMIVWKTVFGSYKTNLNLKDRLLLGLFSLGVKDPERAEINLAETPLLVKTKLNDGTLGYKVRESNVAKISALFGDSQVSDENLGLVIVYPEDKAKTAEKFGEVIQVLGAKVTSLESSDQKDLDCEVVGVKSQTRRKIADVFDCKVKDSTNQDIEIHFGDKFVKRF